MMEVSGPRGLGEQGLLGAPPAAHKKKPNYMFSTHTPHNTHHTHTTQHTHSCNCTQPSRSTPKAGTNNTGTEIGLSNMDTPNGITAVKELRNTHTTRCSQTSESTNEIREERDQNSTDGITAVRYFRDILPFHNRFLQQLGDRHLWVLYHVSFSDSPDQ